MEKYLKEIKIYYDYTFRNNIKTFEELCPSFNQLRDNPYYFIKDLFPDAKVFDISNYQNSHELLAQYKIWKYSSKWSEIYYSNPVGFKTYYGNNKNKSFEIAKFNFNIISTRLKKLIKELPKNDCYDLIIYLLPDLTSYIKDYDNEQYYVYFRKLLLKYVNKYNICIIPYTSLFALLYQQSITDSYVQLYLKSRDIVRSLTLNNEKLYKKYISQLKKFNKLAEIKLNVEFSKDPHNDEKKGMKKKINDYINAYVSVIIKLKKLPTLIELENYAGLLSHDRWSDYLKMESFLSAVRDKLIEDISSSESLLNELKVDNWLSLFFERFNKKYFKYLKNIRRGFNKKSYEQLLNLMKVVGKNEGVNALISKNYAVPPIDMDDKHT